MGVEAHEEGHEGELCGAGCLPRFAFWETPGPGVGAGDVLCEGGGEHVAPACSSDDPHVPVWRLVPYRRSKEREKVDICEVADPPDFIHAVMSELLGGKGRGGVRGAEQDEVEPSRGGVVDPSCGKQSD